MLPHSPEEVDGCRLFQFHNQMRVKTDVPKRFALFAEFQKTIVCDKRVCGTFVGAEGPGGNAAQIHLKDTLAA